KFEALAHKSVDAQMVEHLKYSDEQICQPFGIPPFKVGIGTIPSGLKADDINLLYYSDALSDRIEAMENLLDEALNLSADLGIWQDISPLMRMDEGKQAEVESALVKGRIKQPDEARLRFDLEPTAGGATLWGQHQDCPLGVLAKRDDLKPVKSAPEQDDATAKALASVIAQWNTHKAITAMREALHE